MKMVHVFGTQWNHWGTTFMVNKKSFPEDTKYVKIIEHLSNLNFVKAKRAIASNCLYDVYLIDYNNDGVSDIVSLIESKTKQKNVHTLVPSMANPIWVSPNLQRGFRGTLHETIVNL
jgi:hypothetical protein